VDLSKTTIATAGGEQYAFEMRLKKKFEWLHSAEFKSLWRQQIRYKEASGHQLQPREVLIERFDEWERPAPKEEDKKEDAIQTNDKNNVLKNSTFPSDPSSSIPLQKSKTLVGGN
jgi:hypothetical protein